MGWSSYSLQIENMVKSEKALEKIDAVFLEKYTNFCQGKYAPRDAWKEFVAKYPEAGAVKTAAAIEAQMGEALKLVETRLPTTKNIKLKIMFVIGCQRTDATALLGKDTTYVFFDVFTLFNQSRQETVDKVFLVHELLHGIQFSMHPEFAPANYKTDQDKFMKFIINEGVASYFAQKITGASDHENFWPGSMLNEKQFQSWMAYKDSEKSRFSKRVAEYLKSPKSQPDLLKDMFYVLSLDNLDKKRTGYYYGADIVKNFDRKHNKGADISYKEIEPFIKEYFSIKKW